MGNLRKAFFRNFINFWPPYWAAGIRVMKIAPDKTSVEVEMKLKMTNQNYVGTHFGGSLYAMCDPFFMLILIENLGRDYIVWDKAATIRFRSPGLSRVPIGTAFRPTPVSEHRTVPVLRPAHSAPVGGGRRVPASRSELVGAPPASQMHERSKHAGVPRSELRVAGRCAQRPPQSSRLL